MAIAVAEAGKKEDLAQKVELLELGMREIKKKLVTVGGEKKDINAWARIEKIGKEISKSWKSSKYSWQLIAEGRK